MDFITGTEGKDYSIGLGKPATFIARRDESGQVERSFLDAGESAPIGALVYYYLPEYVPGDGSARDPASLASRMAEERYSEKFGADPALEPTAAAAVAAAAAEGAISVSLAFLDKYGNVVREFRPKPPGYDKLSDEDKALDPGPWMPLRAGVNRFVWDLRYSGAKRLRGNKTGEEADRGPLVLPGTYRVRLRFGCQEPDSRPPRGPSRRVENKRFRFAGREDGANFEVVNDPRSPATLDDLREQLRLLLAMRDKISDAYEGVQRIRSTSGEIEHWCARLSRHGGHDAAREAGEALHRKLAEVESALILPGGAYRHLRPASPGPPERGPRLRHQHRGQRRRPPHGSGPGACRGVHRQDRHRARSPEGPPRPRPRNLQRTRVRGGSGLRLTRREEDHFLSRSLRVRRPWRSQLHRPAFHDRPFLPFRLPRRRLQVAYCSRTGSLGCRIRAMSRNTVRGSTWVARSTSWVARAYP